MADDRPQDRSQDRSEEKPEDIALSPDLGRAKREPPTIDPRGVRGIRANQARANRVGASRPLGGGRAAAPNRRSTTHRQPRRRNPRPESGIRSAGIRQSLGSCFAPHFSLGDSAGVRCGRCRACDRCRLDAGMAGDPTGHAAASASEYRRDRCARNEAVERRGQSRQARKPGARSGPPPRGIDALEKSIASLRSDLAGPGGNPKSSRPRSAISSPRRRAMPLPRRIYPASRIASTSSSARNALTAPRLRRTAQSRWMMRRCAGRGRVAARSFGAAGRTLCGDAGGGESAGA